jgi:hypothetical protein
MTDAAGGDDGKAEGIEEAQLPVLRLIAVLVTGDGQSVGQMAGGNDNDNVGFLA